MNLSLPDSHLWLTSDEAHTALKHGTGQGIKIAVIDSGIDFSHPALQNTIIEDNVIHSLANGILERIETEKPFDPSGHGTAIASIIHKTAPNAILGSFRVFEGKKKGGPGRAIRDGIKLATEKGYHIINCSFGIPGRKASGEFKFVDENKKWVDGAFLGGQHIVAACNNDDHAMTEWPGHLTSAITVDGINCEEDELFWCRGEFADFGAKGVDVDVAWKNHETLRVDGSSYAAPRIAGWIARILSVHPHIDPVQMKGILRLLAYERPRFRLQSGRNLGQEC